MAQDSTARPSHTLTDFVVTAAHDAARRAVEDAEIVLLSREDQRRFAEALLRPAAPKRALRKAFQGRRELLGQE